MSEEKIEAAVKMVRVTRTVTVWQDVPLSSYADGATEQDAREHEVDLPGEDQCQALVEALEALPGEQVSWHVKVEEVCPDGENCVRSVD